MKKIKKSLLVITLMGMLLMVLSGCGNSNKSNESGLVELGENTDMNGKVYVPEYTQFAIECDYINEVTVAGDKVFFDVYIFDEETGSSETIYIYDMLENKTEKLNYNLGENDRAFGMAVNTDGNLILGVDHTEYTMDENGDATDYNSTMELNIISVTDGSVLDTRDITGLFGDSEYQYVQYCCLDGQGNVYLYNGEGTICVLDKEFQKLFDINSDGWINAMAASKEGDVYISTYGENGIELKKIDLTGKKIGETVSGFNMGYGNYKFYTGINESMLVSDDNRVLKFDIPKETSQELLDWMDMDINGSNIQYMGELSDGRIWAVSETWNTDEQERELILLNLKDASEIEEKEEIVFGAMWLDSDLKKCIIDYNKKSDKYHIKVKEYGTDDYSAGMTQFNADIATGNCPDIIDISSLDFEQYANKGVFEDLYPYMEKSGIKEEDYLENILKAYEIDGKLYGIMSEFYVRTNLVKASLVDGAKGWTLSEMLDFAEDKDPETLFRNASRSSILYFCVYNNIDEFIDWETGKCSFDGDGFARTLEFAAKFPEEYDWSREQEEGLSAMLHSNKLLIMENSFGSVQEVQLMNGMFGEKVSYIGYPDSEREGNLIQATGGSLAMSSKSEHKEGAWEFMKTILSEEYQDSMITRHGGFGFPVKKSSLEKQFELDMTPEYYEDENGDKVEQPKTTWQWDDFSMEIMAATQEEIDTIKELIESASKVSGNADEEIVNIITEESEPFFNGQKSAADVAGIIQNRVQIYVNENR